MIHADDDGKTLAEREVEYEKFVWANLKRNYIAHYLHGMLGMTGFRLVNAPTFLPAYLYLISGSSFIVGLGLALQQVGGMISPIFGATQIEHRKRVMPAAVWMGGLARVQILGMALAGWFLSGQPLVIAILAFMFMFGLFMGTQRVVFSLLMAKVIPISRRGRLQAWRNATGGVIAAALAWVAGKYFIEGNLLGNGYASTFLFATILTSMGLWALQFLMIEPEPPTTRVQTPFLERLKDFPRLISQDRGYMFFLIVQMLSITGRMATPFYILYVSTTIELTGANIGLLSLAFLGADTLSNLVWGYLGDKTGFRVVLVSSLVIWIAATVLLMNVHEVAAIFVAFFGLGAAQSGYMMSAQTMILEFGSRDELPMRIALSSTAEGVMASAGPLVGGIMAATLGYESVFGTSIAFLTAGLLLLLFMVREPRKDRMAPAG
ncbi:MFS transporter [Phenylobacterium sp.]|uniref:MFS transporter n=1 Tax=Phenylobacterium sp. TaxID=1871053 RepID=UPI00300227DB